MVSGCKYGGSGYKFYQVIIASILFGIKTLYPSYLCQCIFPLILTFTDDAENCYLIISKNALFHAAVFFCFFFFGLHVICRFLVEDQEEESTLKRHSSALDMILTRSSAVLPSSFLGSTKSSEW